MTDERTKLHAVNAIAHELAASLCKLSTDEADKIARENVMQLVSIWRSKWDAALASQQKSVPCVWSEEYEGPWESACGHAFNIIEGGPAENGMKFCCFCGAPINAISYDEGAENEG